VGDPFFGLVPAPGREHARWVVEAMHGRSGIALVVPEGFEAYVRIHHRLDDGRRWTDSAQSFLRRGTTPYDYPYPDPLTYVEGDLGAELVDHLIPLLAAATSDTEGCHFALWRGWGGLHPGSQTMLVAETRRDSVPADRLDGRPPGQTLYSFVDACPVEPWWGGRDMLLFDGPLERVKSIGTLWRGDQLDRRAPQWWWPADRAWFVGTEIDYPWTYLAGSAELITRLLQDPTVETVRVEPADEW
jgi:hypothetical protein